MEYKSPSTIDLGEKIKSDLKNAKSKIDLKQSQIINLFDKLVTEDNKYSEYIVYNLVLHFMHFSKKVGEGVHTKKSKKTRKPLTKRILLKKKKKQKLTIRRKRSKKIKK